MASSVVKPINSPQLSSKAQHLSIHPMILTITSQKILLNNASRGFANKKYSAPDKPFFVYWAPGATHAPHHAPPEWIEKYKGKFDQGWDKVREDHV